MTEMERKILDICCLWAQGGYTDHEAMMLISEIIQEGKG